MACCPITFPVVNNVTVYTPTTRAFTSPAPEVLGNGGVDEAGAVDLSTTITVSIVQPTSQNYYNLPVGGAILDGTLKIVANSSETIALIVTDNGNTDLAEGDISWTVFPNQAKDFIYFNGQWYPTDEN